MKIIKKLLYKDPLIEERVLYKAQEKIREEMFLPITETQEQDVFIAGYPKSGNTWMQNLISGLLFGIDTALLPDNLTQELVPDVHSKEYYKRFGQVTFFKTHDLPQRHMRRVIHLIRDGRDVMASYYAMNIAQGKESTLKEMIVEGKDIYPSKWFVHAREWLKNPFNAEILVVRFEDLIDNPFQEMNRILDFVKIKRSSEIIQRTITGNSFKEMKRKEKDYGWNNKNWNPKTAFIRKGEVGSYRIELPEDLIKAFESESKRELNHFNYIIYNK